MQYGIERYGVSQYGDSYNVSDSGYFYDEKVFLMMLDYLPKYYHEMKEARESIKVDSIEISTVKNSVNDIVNQYFIDTATWGLELWEKLFDIKTDLSLTYEERRSIIKAKVRGQGTTTKEMIKNVAASFSGGEVDVINNYQDYSIEIKFIGTLGVPKKIDDLTERIKDIIPAHLNFKYTYSYLTWNDLVDKFSWNQVKTVTWGEIKALSNPEEMI